MWNKRILLSAIVLGAMSPTVWAQRAVPYPRIDTQVSYEVDESWPKRPESFPRGSVSGIGINDKNEVFVYTRAVPPVQVYDTEGNFLRSWGEDHISQAHHLKIAADGTIWVADIGHHTIMQFTPDGRLLRGLGTPDEPGEDETHFNKPTDVAFASNGDIFVSDGYGNDRVVHLDKNGKFIKAWGKLGLEPGQFSCPHAIAIDSKDRIYIADRNNGRVQVFNTAGKLIDLWAGVVTPWGFSISADDEIWICGSTPSVWKFSGPEEPLGCPPRDQAFMKFRPDGRLMQIWTVPKGADGKELPGELNWVHCMAFDRDGNIYAGDIKGERAQKFKRIEPRPPAVSAAR